MKFLILVLLTVVPLQTANAFWEVQSSEEDVFGNENVTAMSIGDNGNLLRFECGSSDIPFFVFLIRSGGEEVFERDAIFLHIDQNGNRQISKARLRNWNDTYAAVMVVDESAIRALAGHMIVATSGIAVGIEIPDIEVRVSDTFSSYGSTRAGQTILGTCF